MSRDARLYVLLLPSGTPNLPPAATSDCSERWSDFPFAVFVFDDGLIRLASQAFPRSADSLLSSLHSPLVHLTNNSLNAAGNGGAASNRSFLRFMRQLAAAPDSSSRLLAARIAAQVDECVLSTVASSSALLSAACDSSYSRHFELLGFDVLLDERAAVWLCEVNSMPDLQCAPSAFAPLHRTDFECKRRLLADTFNLLGLHDRQHTQAHGAHGATAPLGGFRRVV